MSIIKVKKIVYLNFPFGGHLSRPLAYRLTGLLFLLFLANISFAKISHPDSSKDKLVKTQTSSSKELVSLFKYVVKIQYTKPDSALKIIKIGIGKAEKKKNIKLLGRFWEIRGNIYWHLAKYSKSLHSYNVAQEKYKEIGDKKDVTNMYSSIGYIYMELGDYKKAMDFYVKSLEMSKKNNNQEQVMIVKAYMVNLYLKIKEYRKAINILQTVTNYFEQKGSYNNVVSGYVNLSNVYSDIKRLDSALLYCQEAKKVIKEHKLNIPKREAGINLTLGSIYEIKKQYKKALQYTQQAYLQFKELKATDKVIATLNLKGTIYIDLKQYEKAETDLLQALEMVKKIDDLVMQSSILNSLSTLYAAKSKFKKAYNYQKEYTEMKDSIFSIEMVKKITSISQSYKWEKQQLEIKNLRKSKLLQQSKIKQEQAKNKRQTEQRYFMIIGMSLLLILLFFILRGYRIKKKANNELAVKNNYILEQKEEVEIKNKEINASINYAKRIQDAMLPSHSSFEKNLKKGFVLFKPKDIVSGDFYWLETAPQGGAVYFAAADCTGHGVPGAMVSVVCANALSKALLEENITETGKLLDRTREIVIQQFSHSDENVKDGMDISLCKLTPSESGGGLLQWSGANNPLWIIRQNVIASPINREKQSQSNYEFTEIKGNKQPIGKTDNPKPFTTHNIELQKGDSIYIFSDGFADQFGGEDGKKFKYKPLKDMLLSLQSLEINKQEPELEKAFNEWKGEEEQVDDICIMGIRI